MGERFRDLDDPIAVAHVLRIYVVVDRRVDPVFHRFMLIPCRLSSSERETVEDHFSASQRGQFVYAWSAVDERGWAQAVDNIDRLRAFCTEPPAWVVDRVNLDRP